MSDLFLWRDCDDSDGVVVTCDLRFGVGAEPQPVLAPEAEAVPEVVEPWTGEPETIQQLQEAYVIEGKMAGRCSGLTMFLTMAKRRDGSLDQVQDRQKWKLFLAPSLDNWSCLLLAQAAHNDVELDTQEYLIAHGPSKFIRSDRVEKLKREDNQRQPGMVSGMA